MKKEPHVMVVGGGIAGTAVAIELARNHARVTLVDRDQPGSGATGASAGMLAPQYEARGPDPLFHFSVACRDAFPAFLERLEKLADWNAGLRVDGMLVANRTVEEEDQAARDLAFQQALGLEGEILTPAEAKKIHQMTSPDVTSWLWLPTEAQVDAQRLAVALADAAQAAGVDLVRGAEVQEIRVQEGRVGGVRLAGGQILECDAVVLAAGAWARQVGGLPAELPVWPVRGQMLRLLPAKPLPWTLVCNHEGRYIVPRSNRTVLVGSTMEEVGFDDRVTEEGRQTLSEAAVAMIPELADATIVEAWAGFRPMSGDQWPILGPDPMLEGLFYAAGHGRNGVLFSPLVGKSVAELVLDGQTEVAWEPFGVQRFRDG